MKKLVVLLSIFQLFAFIINAQTETLSDANGEWSDDSQWVGGTSPGSTPDGLNIIINGNITHTGDLTFDNGLLTITDTLIINGNLDLLNNGDLTIGPNGILIVNGEYTSEDEVVVSDSGYMIITDTVTMLGIDANGSFTVTGELFILDNNPTLKSGVNYSDLACSDPDDYPANCGYGNALDLANDPIYPLFVTTTCTGSYVVPSLTGPSESYEGIGQTYITEYYKKNYAWIVTGGTIVSGQGTNIVVVEWDNSGNSSIQVSYTDTSGCTGKSYPQDITVEQIPVSCFTYRRQLSISNAVVNGASDLTDFPYLINVQHDSLKHIYHNGHITHYNGYDVMFTQNSDGTNMLDHQIDHYDPTTGELWVWVKIPTLSQSANTELYMFYGNYNIIRDLSTETVWSNDYVTVYHMGNDLNDAGPTENYGINNGTSVVDGYIGLGREFERDETNFINVTNEPDFNFDTTMSFSFWVNIESYPDLSNGAYADWMDIMIKGDNANFRVIFSQYLAIDDQFDFAFHDFYGTSSANNTAPTATWIHVAGTWDGKIDPVDDRKSIFVNGVQYTNNFDGSDVRSIQDGVVNNYSVVLGYNQQAPSFRSFDGILDEVRLSSETRTPEWLITEYNNQSNPNHVTVGGEITVATLSAVGGSCGIAQDSIQSRYYVNGTLSGYTGTIQWQSSTDNITYRNEANATSANFNSKPLLETTYFRALVSQGGCGVASTVDSVYVNPGFIACDYHNRMRLDIDESNVTGANDLEDFAVLVHIEDQAELRTVGNGGVVQNVNGYDIIFAAEDGTTQLAHELEYYDGTEGDLKAWVKVPSLKAEETTKIYVYYGKVGVVDNPSTSATWSNEYIGVWHMSDSTGTTVDATGNANLGTFSGTTQELSGKIGEARVFDGIDDFISIAQEQNFDVADKGKLTVSGWLRADAFTGADTENFVSKGANSWSFNKKTSTSNAQFYADYTTTDMDATNTDVITDDGNTWHYVSASFDHDLNSGIVFIDGSSVNSSKNFAAGNRVNNNNQVTFGADPLGTAGTFFAGAMDEIRIQNVARNSDWFTTEYTNQNDPVNFVVIGDEQTCNENPVPGTASAAYPKVCIGQSTEIILSGYDGNIYWQQSEDNINWTYMNGENDSNLIVRDLTDTMYYRATVSKCCELFSNTVRIDFYYELPPIIDNPGDTAVCDSLVLPVITGENLTGSEAYYFAQDGGGAPMYAGDVVKTTGDIYIYDNNGNCFDEVIFNLTINASPTITLGSNSPLCYDTDLNLAESGGQATSWDWTGPNSFVSTDQNPSISNVELAASGWYVNTISDGTCSKTDSVQVTVNPLPTITLESTDTTICIGDEIVFTATGGSNYNFKLNGISVQDGTSDTYTSDSLADGDEIFVVVTDVNTCVDSNQATPITMVVNDLPLTLLASSIPNDTICDGTEVVFTAGAGSLYEFKLNGITDQSGASDIYTISNLADGDSVYAIVTDNNGCVDSTSAITTTVHDLPVPGLLSDAAINTICAEDQVIFTAEGGTNYNFKLNNVTVQDDIYDTLAISTLVDNDEMYVVVTDSNGCVDSTSAITTTVNPLPTAVIGNDLTEITCTDTSIVLRGKNSIVVGTASYSWSTADGAITGDLANDSVFARSAGTYILEVTDVPNGCIDSASVVITQSSDVPTATILSDTAILNCNILDIDLDGSTSVSGTGNPISFSWTTSDGNITTRTDSTGVNIDAPGTYQLEITDDLNGCDGIDVITITQDIAIPNTPAISGNDNPSCRAAGETYSVAFNSGSKYYWSIPADAGFVTDTSGLEVNSIIVDFGTNDGVIQVTETAVNGCVGSTVSLDITVSGCYIEAGFDVDTNQICLDGSVVFTDTSVGTTGFADYSWDFGDGATPATATGKGPHTVTYSTEGAKDVSLTVTDGFSDTETKAGYIVVSGDVPGPASEIVGLEAVCIGTDSVLYVSGAIENANHYRWSLPWGVSQSDLDSNITYLYFGSMASTGYLSLYGENGCGTGESSRLLINSNGVNPASADTVLGADFVCQGDQEELYITDDVRDAVYYNWVFTSTNDTLVTDTNIVEISFSDTAKSGELYVFVENGCGIGGNSDSLIIEVESIPVKPDSLAGPQALCPGKNSILYSVGKIPNADYYYWDYSGSGANYTSSEEPFIMVGYDINATSGAFTVYAGNECGSGDVSDELLVTVNTQNECIDIVFDPDYFTNTFTPNNDGFHDYWIINDIQAFPDAKVEVFDRWGRRVFFKENGYDNSDPWDGSYNGSILPMDGYMYVIDVFGDGSEVVTGTLNIIR